MMAIAAGNTKARSHWMLLLGFGIWIVAIVWWLAYYGQWNGWFGLLDVKLACLMGGAMECDNFQEFIGPSVIPVYSPIAWYIGVICVVVGLVLTRQRKV